MQIVIYDLANCGRGRSLSYDIQEDGDNRSVNDVGKHRTDDGHDEEELDRVTVLIANRAHVCHRVGGGTEAEACQRPHSFATSVPHASPLARAGALLL